MALKDFLHPSDAKICWNGIVWGITEGYDEFIALPGCKINECQMASMHRHELSNDQTSFHVGKLVLMRMSVPITFV